MTNAIPASPTIESTAVPRTRRLYGSRAERAALLALIAIAVGLWVGPFRSSLWLDETGTYWVVKDGIRATIHRSLDFQGQSPLYYLIAFLVTRAAGASEAILRLPSLISMIGAAAAVYVLGVRFLDKKSALLAVVAFAATGGVAFAAADARPYSLALFVSTWSTVFLVRWMDSGRRMDHVAYVVFSVLTLYTHYLFGITLLAHAFYFVARRDKAPFSRDGIVTGGIVALVCLPLFPQLFSLWRRGPSLSWTGDPQFADLLAAVAHPLLLFSAGLLLARMTARSNGSIEAVSRKAFGPQEALLLTWALAAPILIFSISKFTSAKLFDPKYFLSTAPALALILGWAVSRVTIPFASVAVGIAILIAGTISYSSVHVPEDWRAAVAFANARTPSQTTPVLVSTGFVESRSIEWLQDPKKSAFVLAPLAYYRVDGTALALPADLLFDEGRQYVHTLARSLGGEATFVVITNFVHVVEPFLLSNLSASGYGISEQRSFGKLSVSVFSKHQ